MNFIKRGITSIIRKPGKTIILLLIIFILGNVIAGAVSVRQAVARTEENIRKSLSPVATIGYDNKKIDEFYQKNPDGNVRYDNIKVETLKEIGTFPQVKYFDYMAMTSLESNTLKRYRNEEINGGMVARAEIGGGMAIDVTEYFSLYGVQNPEMIDILEGKITLTTGRTFSADEIKNLTYVCMVSKTFAELNSLSVGSKIALANNVYDYNTMTPYVEGGKEEPMKPVASQNYEFEVIGIFDPVKQPEPSDPNMGMDMQWREEEMQNKIYVSNGVVESAGLFQYNEYKKLNPEDYKDVNAEDNNYYTNLYVLKDPADLPAFKEAAAKIIPEMYKVIDTGDSYDTIAAPMKTVQWIAWVVLIVAIGATLLILSLLITLFLRDRKHEIGIYLSLGERKGKVVAQVLLEVLLIAAVAMSLSLFSGNLLSGAVSDKMLSDQIIQEQEQDNMGNSVSYYYSELDSMGYSNALSSDSLVENYSVSLDLRTILIFFAVGLGTVVVSTLIPIIYIVRLNPKKILM